MDGVSVELAVLEARWWKGGNHSVRPMFDTLAAMHHNNPFAYRYEMFCDEKSFATLVESVGRTKGVSYLHVASHGTKNALLGAPLYNKLKNKFENATISRTQIKNAIRRAITGRGTLKGIYFGSCSFGNLGASDFVLSADDLEAHKLVWVAGYDTRVNWVDAAVVEMYFWDQFRYFRRKPPVARVLEVAQRIMEFMPGASKELGFDIFVRKKGRDAGIVSIMQEKLSPDQIAH